MPIQLISLLNPKAWKANQAESNSCCASLTLSLSKGLCNLVSCLQERSKVLGDNMVSEEWSSPDFLDFRVSFWRSLSAVFEQGGRSYAALLCLFQIRYWELQYVSFNCWDTSNSVLFNQPRERFLAQLSLFGI